MAIGELVDERGGVLLVLTGVHVDGRQQNLQQHTGSGAPAAGGKTEESGSEGPTGHYQYGPEDYRDLFQT